MNDNQPAKPKRCKMIVGGDSVLERDPSGGWRHTVRRYGEDGSVVEHSEVTAEHPMPELQDLIPSIQTA